MYLNVHVKIYIDIYIKKQHTDTFTLFMLNVYFHFQISNTKVLISFTSHIVDEEPTDVIHKNRVT